MRRFSAFLLMAVPALACAQIPDVRVKFDLTLSLRSEKGEPPVLKPFSALGRHSTLALIFYMEPGFRGYVSQKIQRIPGEVDPEPLDEYYVEDEGIWRLGKQYLPFGTGQILRESALAARADSNLILERWPLQIAAFDAGAGYQRGMVGRIGNRIGASVAVGKHLGIASTALTLIRRPEDSPGRGRGWRFAYGFDYTRRVRQWTYRLEGVALRRGETPLDDDLTLGDLSATYAPTRATSATIGWTRILDPSRDVFRVSGSFKLDDTTWLEPMFRYRSRNQFDVAMELRLRF